MRRLAANSGSLILASRHSSFRLSPLCGAPLGNLTVVDKLEWPRGYKVVRFKITRSVLYLLRYKIMHNLSHSIPMCNRLYKIYI